MESPHSLAGGFADPVPAPIASRRHLLRFLFIVVAIAAATCLQARSSTHGAIGSRIPLYLIFIAVEVLMVRYVAIGLRPHRGKLRQFLGRSWKGSGENLGDIALALGLVFLLRTGTPVFRSLLGHWSPQTGFLLPRTFAESIVWIVLSIAAGICEEIVYRGYLQTQLWNATRSLPLAIVLQAAVFGGGHIYQGWKPALVTALYGLAFGLVAAWRRSVVPGAIAHTLVDIIGGLAR